MAILARARIGLLLLCAWTATAYGRRALLAIAASSLLVLLGCPGWTRPDKRLASPLQACRPPGCGARPAATGNPEAPVTRGARSRHARSTSTCTARPRAGRRNLSGRRADHAHCSRQVATVSQAVNQTPETDDPRGTPSRPPLTPALPLGEGGVRAPICTGSRPSSNSSVSAARPRAGDLVRVRDRYTDACQLCWTSATRRGRSPR